jgi:hypothetical protein
MGTRVNKKIILIVSLIGIIIVGAGAWVSLTQNTPSSSNTPVTKQKDITAPTVELNIPSSSLELAKTSKTLVLSADISGDNEAVVRVEYLLDGKVVARSIEPPFKVTIDLAGLKPGDHTIQAVAYDQVGNKGKSKVFTFTLADDTVAPTDEDSSAIIQSSTPIAKKKSSGATVANTTGGSDNSNSGGDTPSAEPQRTAGGWFSSLPSQIQICSSDNWNSGPASAPQNAIIVPAGDNSSINFTQDNKTFWFAPGTHTLGTGQFSQIYPGNNSTYIGAPLAILDGTNHNQYAFSGSASNVRIAYLEIRNFGRGNDNNNEGVINHDSGTGWTMEYLYAHNNDGAAVFIGSNNIVRNNCLKDNGQYGFSMYKPQVEGDSAIKNIVIDHNEIAGNNQDDWEHQIIGCGCTGGGKFWDVRGATVTNNYVHDNLSTGLWADTNDIDFKFDSNWIEHNSGEGIWYEISYNATMSRNVIKRNAWAGGNNNLGSPAPAIYISESGGDSRLPSTVSGSTDLRINNNLIQDNFSGVSIFENSNRFCNSNGNTSKTYCTPFVTPTIIPSPYDYNYPNPINNTHPCYTNIGTTPSVATNCRWHSQNVQVFNNEFRFDDTAVPCAGTFCGVQALFATGSDNISWAPAVYNIANVQNAVTFTNNNKFFNNTYVGNWRFAKGYGETIYYGTWRGSPYLQDNGSTFDGQLTPPPVANALDANTAGLEGSIGHWQDWFSTTPTQTTDDAHTGTHSLKVLTTGGSWGLQLDNWPGFATTGGNKRASFWAKLGAGSTITTATLHVEWYQNNTIIQTDLLPISGLTTSWQQALSPTLVAPAGATTVNLTLTSGSVAAGNIVYFDDFKVEDLP